MEPAPASLLGYLHAHWGLTHRCFRKKQLPACDISAFASRLRRAYRTRYTTERRQSAGDTKLHLLHATESSSGKSEERFPHFKLKRRPAPSHWQRADILKGEMHLKQVNAISEFRAAESCLTWADISGKGHSPVAGQTKWEKALPSFPLYRS